MSREFDVDALLSEISGTLQSMSAQDPGKVIIISQANSFLAKSIATKLDSNGIHAVAVPAVIKEIEKQIPGSSLLLLFLSDDLESTPELVVYLKDMIHERQQGLFLIGDPPQEAFVKKIIPPSDITEVFKRPLDIEALLVKEAGYLEENTGEKRKKTVLIVDDDVTYLRTVNEWLKGSYHVGMAASGMQAISYLARNKVDLILLDYEMPIANGPQVLSMLKSDSETVQIPVMFLTGHGDKDRVLSIVGLNPADYLLKTIDKRTLLKKLNDFFEKTK